MSPCLVLTAALLATANPAPLPVRPLDPEAQTMLNMRITAAVLTTFLEQGGRLPSDDGLWSVNSEALMLPSELRRHLLTRDGWGNALRVVSGQDRFAIVSFGRDGKADMNYTDTEKPVRLAEPSPDRDIIWSDGSFLQRPEEPKSLAARAAAELRMIGTAMEAFAVDADVYPGPTGGLQPITAIADKLEPTYIRVLPSVDPWGGSYYVWSDGNSYLLVTAGSDGRLDRAYNDATEPSPGSFASDDQDQVFANGQFVRWFGQSEQ